MYANLRVRVRPGKKDERIIRACLVEVKGHQLEITHDKQDGMGSYAEPGRVENLSPMTHIIVEADF